MRITRKRFIKVLSEMKGSTFVSLLTATVPPMNKTGNPYYGHIEQVCRINGVINWTYEDSVNRQREREGQEPDFQALPRSWGTRVKGTPFVVYKDNTYLEVKVQAVSELWYRYRDSHHIISDDELIRIIKHYHSSRQMLDKEVILRDINVDNILTIRYRNNTYILTQ